ncbi:MAG: transposase [Gammaproteobacteria bacterium]|nr:transposase [Gammaproteobacteria bacterium]
MLSQSTKLTPLGSQTAVARDYYIREFKGDKTVNELASEYDIHPTQINQWKRQALASLLVGVEAEDAEREGQQQALEQRQQEALGDADGGAHELVLGGLVDQVDQVQALGPSRSP